ncbi:MAG TPA: SDR family oxidoreductase [Thermoanaerobaculia bacterium]|nr:SDR family oxidoreductase [Thermoanaerobaculia bacterium]
MQVLLTGHEGYIGAVLAPRLLAAGHQVVGLDAGWFADCAFGDDAALRGLPSLRRDLRQVQASHLAGFDAVVQLAALSNDPLGDLDPALTMAINEQATIRLARLAKEAGVERFVFSSSCSTYGAAGDAFLDEQAPFSPVTPYALSKVRVEAALMALADERFTPVALRNATAYGVSPRLRVDLVLNNLVAWAVTSGKILLMSDGTPWRPIVHVEDICSAFLAALEAPRQAVHAQAFNIGRTAENYRIRELAEIVAATVPGCTIRYAEGAGPDARCYRVSCAKAEEGLPGYAARWDAAAGARELYDAYQAEGLSAERFAGPTYKRLGWIRHLQAAGSLSPDLRWQVAATTA